MRFLKLVLIAIVFPAILSAQDSSAVRNNSLREGAWAAQFQITQNFTLSSFQGTALSIKHHSSRAFAWRIGLGLGLSTGSDDNNSMLTPIDSLQSEGSSDNNSQNIDLRTQFIYYTNPDAEINLFLGAGPQFHYGHSNSENETHVVTSTQSNFVKSNREGSTWGLGLGGVIGIEWFALRSVSIHAEYSSSLEYDWSKFTSRDQSSTTPQAIARESTSKRFFISPSIVRFGLSAYF